MGILKNCPRCGSDFAGRACPTCTEANSVATRAEAAGPLKPGRSFRGLEILEELGRGGMGIVYKARQPDLDRLVALKILPAERAAQPGFEQRFQREAKAMAALSHPNIVSIHEFGQEDRIFYFIMEFVEGSTLRQRRPDAAEAVRLMAQVCDALEFAHKKGIVHRDIKPDNVLVDADGRVRIADFGLAKLADVQISPLTQSGEGLGTLRYMAPEQIDSPHHVDHRADLYSAGVMMYELLTGQIPMGRFEPPSRLSSTNPRLDSVVLKALSRDPAKRYQSAAEFRDELTAAIGDETATVALPRRKTLLPILAAGLVGFGMLAAWLFWPESAAPLGFRFDPPAADPRPDRSSKAPIAFTELFDIGPAGHAYFCAVFSPDGMLIATGTGEPPVVIFEARLGKPMRPKTRGHSAGVTCATYSPVGRRLATGGMDRRIVLWGEGPNDYRILGQHAKTVNSLVYSTKQPLLASAADDGTIKFWDPRAGTEIRSFASGASRVLRIAFSPDGKRLAAACDDGTVRFFTAEGTAEGTLTGHSGVVRALSFSPSGSLIATGGEDGTVRLWDVNAQKESRRIRAHDKGVYDVSFTPDGRYLASGGGDARVRIWDTETGQSAAELVSHQGSIHAAQFSPDGSQLVTAATDRMLKIWEVKR